MIVYECPEPVQHPFFFEKVMVAWLGETTQVFTPETARCLGVRDSEGSQLLCFECLEVCQPG